MTDLQAKIIPLDRLSAWRQSLRQAGHRLVVTNGCFDIVHAGHVLYLTAAKRQGDRLLVGLNSDTSVRQLKGPGRPVNPQEDRALVLAALACVDAVCIFDDLRATRLLRTAEPDLYVKGGDLTPDQIPLEERQAVQAAGGSILIMPHLPGRSTTALLHRLPPREAETPVKP
jgi:D-glycero-beta-D-manno-heptose 1-phosphate adenylyltransferase